MTEMSPQLLSKESVCRWLDGCTTRHLENLVKAGRMPGPVYLGRIPRWPLKVLVEWLNAGCPVVDREKYDAWKKTRRNRSA